MPDGPRTCFTDLNGRVDETMAEQLISVSEIPSRNPFNHLPFAPVRYTADLLTNCKLDV